MFLNENKTFVTWNQEILDSYRDVIISFDYARYSTILDPQGGFAVVFVENNEDVPKLGGPGYSLGYTPNKESDFCYIKGYEGMKNAFLGIGFDIAGNFALKTDMVDGLDRAVPNSCTVRGSEIENYKHIATSKNFYYTPINFLISEKLNSIKDIKFKTIRVIISKAFTNLLVQIKNEDQIDYINVLDIKLPFKPRTAFKVGLTNTFIDNYTKFELKNFNVAGFPGILAEPFVSDCVQTDFLNNYLQGSTTVSTVNFTAIPVSGGVNIYELKNGSFQVSQIIDEVNNAVLLGGNERFLFLTNNESYNVEIFYKLSSFFYKIQTINLKEEIDFEFYKNLSTPICADTDNKNLVIGDGNSLYVFDFITGISTFGFFSYKETLTNHISGFIGRSVQVEKGVILTGGGVGKRFDNERYNSFVAVYEDNGFGFTDNNVQNFASPISGNNFNEFGKIISLQGKEAVIGAPNEYRSKKNTLGQGEAYHYVYTKKKTGTGREWRPAMEIGNFFKLDTVGGNFGSHLSFLGNNLIISAPYENYLNPPDKVFEDNPNVGKVYIFRKNKGGAFTQAAVVTPFNSDKNDITRIVKNMYYGRLVGLFSNLACVITVPYQNILLKGQIDFVKIGCVFDTPPVHLPIKEESYGLYDKGGYIIDMISDTYMQKYIVK
jgi:hypothetical protein